MLYNMLKLLLQRCLPKKENYPKIHQYLAGIYAFSAWTAAIYVFYLSIHESLPTTPERRQKFTEKLEKGKKIEYIKIDGFNINSNE